MYINPRSLIADIPAKRVRDFLRSASDFEWSPPFVAQRLRISDEAAEQLVAELQRLGYVEPVSDPQGNNRFRRTLNGSSFALASAARPITRRTADRKLREILERVRRVNDSDYYLYRVQRVLVFGSYLTGEEILNDVDVAVELVPREQDPDKQRELGQRRISEVLKAGRQFSNYVEQLFWPETEVMLFLKSRSRGISLHTTRDAILNTAKSAIVFEDKPNVGAV